MDSIDYYSKYANAYFESSVNLDMAELRERFMELLPQGGSILDLGCGSGRDSYYFHEEEFDVTPLDGSSQMCALAEIHTDLDVLHMQFKDLDFNEVFDGIWACSSLLHVKSKEIGDILSKIEMALKPGGVFYMSVKKGDFEGQRSERYFVDYSKIKLKDVVEKSTNLEIIDIWETDDVRGEITDQTWLNLLARKAK